MKRFFDRRFSAYLVGLLVSLATMVVLLQAKRAFMPTFHEIRESRAAQKVPTGGALLLSYNEDPGHFLIPGLPSRLRISSKAVDGSLVPVLNLDYGRLVDRKVPLGPLSAAGDYVLEAELYICAGPGVADCSKLLLLEPIEVKAEAPAGALLEVDLPKYAQAGLAAGKASAAQGK
jgi:hypothetical protein